MVNSIGHKREKLKLEDIIKSNAIGHAYLFVGKKSIGKKIVAIEFAKAIMCDNADDGEPCGHCASCKTFENNSDFKLLLPEKDVIKVDMIRELSREIFMLPTISKRKVFIIDDADSMNEQAQNALLKVLEEPPEYATIILIVSNKEKLLNTIKSRIVEFKFNGLTKEEIEAIVGKKVSDEAYEFSNGSIEKVLDFSEDESYEIAKEISNLLLDKDFFKINKKFEEVKADKKLKSNLTDVLEKVMYIYHSRLKKGDLSVVKSIDIVAQALQNLKKNANVDITLDMLEINACEM
jgi:DNA polymerase-3 subunit delta'